MQLPLSLYFNQKKIEKWKEISKTVITCQSFNKLHHHTHEQHCLRPYITLNQHILVVIT